MPETESPTSQELREVCAMWRCYRPTQYIIAARTCTEQCPSCLTWFGPIKQQEENDG